MAPTSPAVRVRITVIRTPQVGFAGANRIRDAERMSNPFGHTPSWGICIEMTPTWPGVLDGAELIWHRADTESELTHFLATDVRWGECEALSTPPASCGSVMSRSTPPPR